MTSLGRSPSSKLLIIPTLGAVLAGFAACDRRPEANGGPRLQAVHTEPMPYPPVADLPTSTAGVSTSAEQFVLVEGDEIVRLGSRGVESLTEVSQDELLRALWRLRGDPLGGRGAASPSAAPLVLAGAHVPAARIVEVVAALWQHGARLAVGGVRPGTAREHPVRLFSESAQLPRAPRGPVVELGPGGRIALSLPGERARTIDGCGRSADTACLARALDTVAGSGARTAFLRRID